MEGELRKPRGLVRINGEDVPGWIMFEAENNEFSQPDTFRATFALSDMPASRQADWWAAETEMLVELLVGFPQDPDAFEAQDLTSIFYGKVDDLSIDYGSLTVEIEGRDLTGVFVDTKTSEKYRNQTASKIATSLAEKYDLTPVVTATPTKVGAYYDRDHVDLQSDRTEWDLLTWLARQEGFRVYTKGKALHFGPASAGVGTFTLERTVDDSGAAQWNAERVHFSRSHTLAKDLRVEVISWNSKRKERFTRVATRARKGRTADTQVYRYRIPNLTPEQAQQRANQLLAEKTAHEMKVEFEGPADADLDIDWTIEVRGTDTAFDQVYYPQAISRRLSVDGGFSWDVQAKNHSPESDLTV